MAPADHPVTSITDLRTDIPAGWTLTGLSAPRSDGVNEYRVPQGDRSTAHFTAPGVLFAELEFQLYSPTTSVTATVLLDGRVIGEQTFPAGTFAENYRVGGFVHGGKHALTIRYQCQNGPCTTPISQYWTQVRLTTGGAEIAREPVGLRVERWILNAPDSPLTITGARPLVFDGTTYVRAIPGPGVQLTWPRRDVTALNATLQIYAPQEIRVTTTVNQEVVSVQRGDPSHAVYTSVSLTAYPDARAVSVQVECLAGGAVSSGCAYLYASQVSIMPSPAVTGTAMAAAGVAAVILLALMFRLLGLRIPVPSGG